MPTLLFQLYLHSCACNSLAIPSVLIKCLLGRAAPKNPALQRPGRLAHTALQTLTQCFKVRPPDNEDLAKHVLRADNSAADAAANFALDSGSFIDYRMEASIDLVKELTQNKQAQIGLLFSCDGAARGNPGPSSGGVCAWWGYFADGGFTATSLIFQKGTRYGNGTNNVAEALALATAVKMALHYYFWMAEQLSRFAQHSMTWE